MQADIMGIKDSQQSMQTEIKSMQADIMGIKDSQQSMQTEIKSMKSEIKDIKGSQYLMQTQLNETNEIVRAIRHRQEETDAKLDALSMDVHKLHGEVLSLKDGQERQERILETLIIRSVEQEADIRDLKRIK
jgi:septal ring factor EnvC (AmiA/AmiB activator)